MRVAHLEYVRLGVRSLQKRLFSSAAFVQPCQGFVYATTRAACLSARSPNYSQFLPRLHHPHPSYSLARAFASFPEMDRSGLARNKRKHSANTTLDRPAKQLKPEAASFPNGDDKLQNGALYEVDSDEDDARLLPLAATADTPEWQATIEKVVKSVVSIHFCQTASFDTDPAISSEATGFVVDAERGYILTNRHVVCAGPFWGYCVFDNHEECDVYPCYVDCVHDFGK